MKEKRIIAIIDYENEFRDEFSKVLDRFGLSDRYELRLVKNFNSSMSKEEMVQQCVSEMQEFKKSLVAIMIDIVIFETATKKKDRSHRYRNCQRYKN